ncbi:MAG TPA: DNA primase [Bryobacteraceae bacterium]|jgi:DNA primase
MDFAQQLKSSIDIVKVVGEYVRLRRMGTTGRYSGLCPFHQEKTPSFSVNQSRQFYKCFGCGVSGDVLKFVMEMDGLTFPETLKQLAERNGIPMPKRSEFADAESRMRGGLLEMHQVALSLFQENLRGSLGAEARTYLAQRGVPPAIVETFGLGYADSSWDALTRRFAEGGIPAAQLDASGLVRKRDSGGYYDYFRGRLMFPIHDRTGQVIGFGGRLMKDEPGQPKYMNSPETSIYRKTSVLYNLHRARDTMRKSNRAVLVEGYMDVIGAYSAGVQEVVASCGTALTADQVSVIRRDADTVVVNFDPDNAGTNAAEKAIQLLLDEHLKVKVLTLEGGLDPDEYVKQNGADVYRAKLDNAPTYFHWLADRARAKHDMGTSDGRMDALKFLLPSVQKITDKLERAVVAQDIASYLGVDQSLVLDQFKRSAVGRTGPASKSPAPPPAAPKNALPAIERLLLSALLGSERARVEVMPFLTPELTEGFVTQEILDALRHSEGDAGFSALEGRLSAPRQALLHELLAADDTSDEDSGWEQAQACLRRLQEGVRKRRGDEIRVRIKAAEREGRLEEALRWAAELHQLEKEIKRGAGVAQA